MVRDIISQLFSYHDDHFGNVSCLLHVEPTSGLDSYSAMKIIKVLKKVAHAGSSVIFTIHQPASDVFMSFDNLLLMNKGRIMSAVPAVSTAKYFASRGHPVPVHFNPADWIMVRSYMTTCFVFKKK
jgi:ABC-type multidrug transport system ATPase subunit